MSQPIPNPISQETINKTLWEACNTFRGTVDPSEYKNYILMMLFLKYISDVSMEYHEQSQQKYAGDPQHMAHKLKNEPLRVPDNCDFYSLYAQRYAPNIGEIIDKALSAIEDANKEKLEGVFRRISFNSESALGRTAQRNERLKLLLENFNKDALNLRPSRLGNLDIIGNAYEYLITRFASDAGKKAGEFYTPPEVSTLLAGLLTPQAGDRIYDPACGIGSLLIKCAKQVGNSDYSIRGQERNASTWALCVMNMLLHGIPVTAHQIALGDTLREPMFLEHGNLMRFDVVVANPPFSLDKWGADDAAKDPYNRFHRGLPPKSKGDYAFISHMVEVMSEENGRMGVIVPHGVLFRGGTEGEIRRKLVEEGLLDAVIGLPSNLFYGTGIPAAILIFKRNRLPDSPILFIDASRDFERGKGQNRLSESQIDKIVKTYHSRNSMLGYSRLIDLSEIEENDFNLNIPRYIDEPFPDSGLQSERRISHWKGHHEIFVSYSRADKEICEIVEQIFTDENLRCWVDREINQGDSSWQKTIENAIEQCHSLVVLLTPQSKDREWIRREIEYARVHDKKIFPVIIDGDEKTSMPLSLVGSQACFLKNDKSHLLNIAEQIFEAVGFSNASNQLVGNWLNWIKNQAMDWRIVKLGDVIQITTDQVALRKYSSEEGNYKLYDVFGNETGLVYFADFDGDYVILPKRISIEKSPSELVWMASGQFSLSNVCHVMTTRDNQILLNKFLYYVLKISDLRYIGDVGDIQNILLRDLMRVEIPLPPVEVQREIVNDLDEEIEINQRRIARLKKQLELLEPRTQSRIYHTITDRLIPR